MSGSAKGRVIGSSATRGKIALSERPITGTCAWCGWEIQVSRIAGYRCTRCDSDEIDWQDPPPAPPHHLVRDDHTPGSIAFGVLGGFVRDYRHGN